MQAVRNAITHVVSYLLPDDTEITLNAEGLRVPGFLAIDIRPETHQVIPAVAPPAVFVGGALTYDGSWVVIDQAAIDAKLEADAQNQAAQRRAAAKIARQVAVDSIKVTTSTGRVFDGDEVSQTRMNRAITGLQASGVATIRWTLADNSAAEVTAAELTEAMILAGQEQARVWELPL